MWTKRFSPGQQYKLGQLVMESKRTNKKRAILVIPEGIELDNLAARLGIGKEVELGGERFIVAKIGLEIQIEPFEEEEWKGEPIKLNAIGLPLFEWQSENNEDES